MVATEFDSVDGTSVINLNGVTKDYGRLRALDDVSLSIGRGVTGLLGPNGAGKSTLIKVLLGLVRVTKGGGDLLGLKLGSESRAIRRRVGYMSEDDCYLPGLTGIETVQLTAQLSRLPEIEGLRRAHEILDFCGIEQERYRLVETYSTGMRQKLNFAQAIVHDPPVLVLDEPTSGLDPTERQVMLSRIRVLSRDAGKSVLICTHILPDVQAISDSVVILARGKVRVSESLDKLNRPTSPSVHVRVVGDNQPLVRCLNQAQMIVEEKEGGTLVVAGDAQDCVTQIWNCAAACGAVVRTITSSQNSLEEIFVEAVRENQSARS